MMHLDVAATRRVYHAERASGQAKRMGNVGSVSGDGAIDHPRKSADPARSASLAYIFQVRLPEARV